jgi:hypothetical protein
LKEILFEQVYVLYMEKRRGRRPRLMLVFKNF